MQFNEMLNIIDRIEMIDDQTTDDEIDDILGDVYYLLARECKDYLDSCKEHLDEIVNRCDVSDLLPKQQRETQLLKQTKPTTAKKPSNVKVNVIDRDFDDEDADDDTFDAEYAEYLQQQQQVETKPARASKQKAPSARKTTSPKSKKTSIESVKSDLNDLMN